MLNTASTISPVRVASLPEYRTCCGITGAAIFATCSDSCSAVCACAKTPMARGIQISDAARVRREGPPRLAEIRFSVGINSSFFTWHVNPKALSRWGSGELHRVIFRCAAIGTAVGVRVRKAFNLVVYV